MKFMTLSALALLCGVGFALPQLPFAQSAAVQPAKAQSSQAKRLDKLHGKIIDDYPKLGHISRDDLQTRITQNDVNLVLLDTRPNSEYKIGHIAGAVQIDPDSSAQALEPLDLDGKTVIVYCSVGRRSSHLATRLETQIAQAGAQSVLNLEGGLFGWHNDGRALVNANGATDMIHPYNGFWGNRYITHKNKTSYSLK